MIERALLLTLLAGLATGVGALITVCLPRSRAIVGYGMAFSAGAMLAVSFFELLPSAIAELGLTAGGAAFVLGMLLTLGLDLLVTRLQAGSDPHHDYTLAAPPLVLGVASTSGGLVSSASTVSQRRVALVTTLAVALHNFPEGFVVFAGASQSLSLGLALTIAIAAHNIPEGMAVAGPVLQATGSRSRAFWAGLGSGLLEPIGAIAGGLLLLSFMSPGVVGGMLAFVAGVMVYVSLDELLPAAREQARDHSVALCVVIGIAFMLLTLVMLQP